MSTRCVGCDTKIACHDDNYGEFWYGIPGPNYTDFSVRFSDQCVSILGHQRVYFCPDCLTAARRAYAKNLTAPDALPHFVLDRIAIELRKPALGMSYRYFTRRDFRQLQFT